MICDEMGLGKTYQALAVADYFKDDWPLLVCTTASTRDSWAKHIMDLLPKVPIHYVQVLNNNQLYVGEAKVLITSYNMMERHEDKLMQRKFGFIIFDESHTLKNSKAKCTTTAKRLTDQAKRVVLLSGTPALSRPLELFTQLQMIDGKFMNFMEFSMSRMSVYLRTRLYRLTHLQLLVIVMESSQLLVGMPMVNRIWRN